MKPGINYINKRFIKRLIKLRKAKGYNAEKLAFASGMSPNGYRYIERGDREPKLISLAMSAGGLGIILSKLLDL